MDAPFFLNPAMAYLDGLSRCPYELTTVGDECNDVFFGNIFSRVFAKDEEHGVPYLRASEIQKADLSSGGGLFLARRQATALGYLRIKKGMILVTCSGTLGKCAYADSRYEAFIATHDLIRLLPQGNKLLPGVLYAFLAGRFGYASLTHSQYGSVILHTNPEQVKAIQIPVFPDELQKRVHWLAWDSARLREQADIMQRDAETALLAYAGLKELTSEDYNYFGPRSAKRKTSTFSRKIKDITTLSFNAFNYSERMQNTIRYIQSSCDCIPLGQAIADGAFFSTGSFPRQELDSPKSLTLINQSDIFNFRLAGKKIARRGVKATNLVEYGEIIIAGVGTLGESESFCHAVFASERLVGKLISGEFLRMKPSSSMMSGYLFAWLNSDYGFRLIRSTQTGTKLCRPIQKLLLSMPVPVLSHAKMLEIDKKVKTAQTMLSQAAAKEEEAIDLVESEIARWQEGR